MHHLAAWAQSIDLANTFQAINAVQDPALTTQGQDVRVPNAMPFIIGHAAAIGNTTPSRAQISSPSLRAMTNIDIEPIIAALVFGSFPEQLVHPESPIPVVGNESLNFFLQATGGGATQNYGLVWLADGPQQPLKGSMYTVRATSAITL